MLYKDALIGDYGPHFRGQAFKVDTEIVCVVPRQVEARKGNRELLRELVQGLGGNCDECRNCPVGNGG
ncbi:hypothetical protein ACIQVR_41860 [Streptomyces xanthochromogenes]|uniref:hypothetical protein n=1 Tax=Streptomyces xanthochromogenes TaxID=67384 RepID=UPI003824749C